jgi:hypothetical protein
MTSIEWFVNELNDQKCWTDAQKVSIIQLQAEEMHKTEIIDAYMDRMDCTDKEALAKIIGREYYEKTFKKK